MGIVPNVGVIDGVMILGCVTGGGSTASNVRVIDGMMILGCVTGRDSTI